MKRFGLRARLAWAPHLAAALVLSAVSPASAEDLPPPPLETPAASPGLNEQKASMEAELEQAAAELARSEERQTALAAEIEALEKDRTKINAALILTARKTQESEDAVSAAERRLTSLAENEAKVRASLNERRGVLAELLATLQRIGLKPPPALVARPGDALAAVRSAIILGAVVPELRIEANALAADLTELISLEKKMTAERDALKVNARNLAEERERLEKLIEEKKATGTTSATSLEAERASAAELAGKVDSLKDLIAKLETEIESARRAAEAAEAAAAAAAKAEAEAKLAKLEEPAAPPDPAVTFKDAGRIAPAIPFEKAKGLVTEPVRGVTLRRFGEDDGIGGGAKGLSITTRAGARVVAPADAWVVYAGPFRSHGQLLILNAGGGYHIVLAGMDRIDVELGQFVLAGEPVAVMGDRRLASAASVDILSSQPVLYVEFRKDGASIDPSPWWENSTDEKARG
ncbi:MAG: peptidoglycan DD-metalloendopeptidase family protein [Hyphomicrobiales bacterium]|nr:peptidoglycan DD-metalloendopeptidase family protein [Hyphomicrobiales bacterium]